MVSITVSIPEDMKKKMEQFPEINWSGLVRIVIENKIKKMTWKEEMKRKFAEEKDFTNWTVEIGRKVNQGVAERLKKEGYIK